MTVNGPVTDATGEISPPDVLEQPSTALDRQLEAIFMVADEPKALAHVAAAVGEPLPAVAASVARLVADFDGLLVQGGTRSTRRGFELREGAEGWRIYVRAVHDELVTGFVLTQNPSRLSPAALETLAVIAYKQPISRGQVASIRAVNVDSVVRTLLSRGLVTEAFADPETGAVNYATTDLLLTQLGINSLNELPHLSPLLDGGTNGFEDLF